LLQSTTSIIASEKSERASLVEEEIAAAAEETAGDRARMLGCVERLVRVHDLPGTDFGLNLELPSGAQAYWGRALLTTSLGLNLTLAVDVPAGHRLAQPVRVRDIAPPTDIAVELPGGPLHRAARLSSLSLDRYFVTELNYDSGGGCLRLRQKPVAASLGFDLVLTRGDELSVHVCHIRPDGSEGPEAAQRLSDKDTSKIETLVLALRKAALELARGRGTLEQAMLDGSPLSEQESPVELARRLIAMLAPLVVDIGRRGSAPGELALKRDLGEGRREELYISKGELLEQIHTLPEELRTEFDPLGLKPESRQQPGVIIVSPAAPAITPIRPALIDATRPSSPYSDIVSSQNRAEAIAAVLAGPRWRT
jgi:hypothetical protein